MNLSVPVPQAHKNADDDVELGRILGLLFDHKWSIATIVALFTIVGVVASFVITPSYRADALVQVENVAPTNPLAEVTQLLTQTPPPSESEIGIIRSRMVLGQAVDILNLDLRVTPRRVPVIGDLLRRHEIDRPAFAADWGYAWDNDTIKVQLLSVTDAYLDEVFRLEVLDADRYVLHYQGERLGEGTVGSQAEFLGGDVSLLVESIDASAGASFDIVHVSQLVAINDLRERFDISELGQGTGMLDWVLIGSSSEHAATVLSTIADIYLTQNIQRQSAEARKSLDFLSRQVPVVREELQRAEDQLNAYRTQRDSVDLTLEAQSVLDRMVNLESQINQLSLAEADISQRFTPSHPTYAALLEKKRQLQEEKSVLEAKINGLPETQRETLRLQRDVTVTQAIYVQLRNKVQEMQIAEASTVGNVRVLDNAAGFPEPVAPDKPLIVLMASALGLAVAVGWVMLRALFDRSIESPDQLEQLGLPVYAVVPLSDEQGKLNRRIPRGARRTADAAGLLARHNPADISVEALRSLRTSLHFAMLDSHDNRLMITGPSPEIGKSFITANLAAVCAQNGQRVLVIDGDLRKGRLHRIFGGSPKDGLTEVLSARRTFDEVIRTVEGVDNLAYLSRGMAPPNPSELLASARFTELLTEASARYDLVIIDSPPVLAVTDAAVIGNQVGTSLMVARFGLNPVREVELTLSRLENSGVSVKGAILNAIERKAATAYSYGYYSYTYQ